MWQLDSQNTAKLIRELESEFDPHLRRILDCSMEIIHRERLAPDRERIHVSYLILEYGGCGGPAQEIREQVEFLVSRSRAGTWTVDP